MYTPITGYNRKMKAFLKDTHPNIFSELDKTLNSNVILENITSSNPKKVWWLCDNGHNWIMSVSERTRIREGRKTGGNCPYCSNRKVLLGYNDLVTTHPAISKQWHPIKNDKRSNEVVAGSTFMAWWLCDKGHEWKARVASRLVSECPYCKGKVQPGVDDIVTTHPDIAAQWHPTRNGSLNPKNYKAASALKVWWLCNNNHASEARISSRVLDGKQCPYCKNRQLLVGFNDLSSQAPHLVREWHPTKNNSLTPDKVIASTEQKVWWICDKEHEWETTVAHRFVQQQGCRQCGNQVSKPEKEIHEFLLSIGITPIRNTQKVLPSKKELDFYIPEKNLAIEFNGLYWHTEGQGKNSAYHYRKWLEAKNEGIQLIQIWEDNWNRNKTLVLKLIANKLFLSQEKKVYARNTFVKKVNNKDADAFLSENHIQGYANSRGHLGLFSKENHELVALISFKIRETQKDLEIIRYATSLKVPGGFSKLLKHLENNYENINTITTFSDHCISNGDLYKTSGFVDEKTWGGSRYYVLKSKRVHRLNLTKEKFKKNSLWVYDKNMSEIELARLNSIPIIWDAGKTRWVKHLDR